MEMSSAASVLTHLEEITVADGLPLFSAAAASAAAASTAVFVADHAVVGNAGAAAASAAAAGFLPGVVVLVVVHPNLEHTPRNSDPVAEFLHRRVVALLHLPP